MTALEIYTLIVLPLLVLGIGFGSLWLSRRQNERHTPAEELLDQAAQLREQEAVNARATSRRAQHDG